MNDELRHANNYKYIKREWKNGKWQYTYEDSKGVKGKSSANPLGARSTPQKKIDNATARAKLTTVKTILGTNTPGALKKYLADHRLGTGKAGGDTRRIKSTGPVREDGPDDQNEAAKYISGNADKKTSKSAMQTSKTDLSKARPEKVKTANQKPAQPVKNEKSLVDAAKQKVADIKVAAKKTVANGTDWIKDKLGYDEKERYEQKTKEKKALEEIRKTTKQELAMLKVVNVPGEAGEKIDKIKAAHEKSIAVADKLIENAKRETKKAKEEYSKTVVGIVDNGKDWLRKKLKIN